MNDKDREKQAMLWLREQRVEYLKYVMTWKHPEHIFTEANVWTEDFLDWLTQQGEKKDD